MNITKKFTSAMSQNHWKKTLRKIGWRTFQVWIAILFVGWILQWLYNVGIIPLITHIWTDHIHF